MPVEVAPAVATTTMEITVSKFELLRELTATQGVVERKTTIPILSNYLFEAAGDKLSLTATDLVGHIGAAVLELTARRKVVERES